MDIIQHPTHLDWSITRKHREIVFTVVVDDFDTKYKSKYNVEHLLAASKKL
jgi:hypothetical protein